MTLLYPSGVVPFVHFWVCSTLRKGGGVLAWPREHRATHACTPTETAGSVLFAFEGINYGLTLVFAGIDPIQPASAGLTQSALWDYLFGLFELWLKVYSVLTKDNKIVIMYVSR